MQLSQSGFKQLTHLFVARIPGWFKQCEAIATASPSSSSTPTVAARQGPRRSEENSEAVDDNFTFEEPWEAVENSRHLEEQVTDSLPTGHPLTDQVLEVLAVRVDSDDVLVRTRSGYAMIQLSWCRRSQASLPFPHFVAFESWDDFHQTVYQEEVSQWRLDNPADDWQELLS